MLTPPLTYLTSDAEEWLVGVDDGYRHHHGPNPNEGGGVGQKRDEEEVGDRGG